MNLMSRQANKVSNELVVVSHEGNQVLMPLLELMVMIKDAGCEFSLRSTLRGPTTMTVFGPNEVLDFEITRETA